MASKDCDKLTSIADIPCPKCGIKNNLSATGGTYVNIIACNACGASWPSWKFEEIIRAMKIDKGPIAKLRKAIKSKQSNRAKAVKSKAPPKAFCPYCGSKLKGGVCQRKKCATRKVK